MSNNRRVPDMFSTLDQFSEFIRVLIVVVKRIWPDICGIPAQELIAGDGVHLERALREQFVLKKVRDVFCRVVQFLDEDSFFNELRIKNCVLSGSIEGWLKIFPFLKRQSDKTTASFSNVVLQHLELNLGPKLDLVCYRARQKGLVPCAVEFLPNLILECINFLETSQLFKDGVWKPEIIVMVQEPLTSFVIKKEGNKITITDLASSIINGMWHINANQVMVFQQEVSS